MMSRSLVRAIVAVSVALASIACRDEPARAVAKRAAPADGAMCKEHGVLEAVCTKCNPALAAVFKAKGDWCSEHGFPESFCPVCRPEAGGRPATELASDDGPLDGTKVRLATPEAIRAADLRTEVATEAGGERILVVPARIVYDATRVAVVNARAEGVVERLVADVGTQVRRGAALAVLRSAGLGAERSKLQAAQSRLGVAEAALRRVEALHADGIAPERDLLEARREVEAARAEVDASRASLGMVGAPSDEADPELVPHGGPRRGGDACDRGRVDTVRDDLRAARCHGRKRLLEVAPYRAADVHVRVREVEGRVAERPHGARVRAARRLLGRHDQLIAFQILEYGVTLDAEGCLQFRHAPPILEEFAHFLIAPLD